MWASSLLVNTVDYERFACPNDGRPFSGCGKVYFIFVVPCEGGGVGEVALC